jgi:hypothetical protein
MTKAFVIPGKPVAWIIGGFLGGLVGLGLDLAIAGTLAGEAAKWGGFGALVGCSVGLMAVAGKFFARR